MSGFGRAPTEQHSRRLSDCGAAFVAEDPDLVKGRRECSAHREMAAASQATGLRGHQEILRF
jgi:hypothetical protein